MLSLVSLQPFLALCPHVKLLVQEISNLTSFMFGKDQVFRTRFVTAMKACFPMLVYAFFVNNFLHDLFVFVFTFVP